MPSDKLRVLIADDEALARERLARLVSKSSSFEIVAEAENGQRAIELARQHHPDIALLDIRMPTIDGIQAASEISKLEPPPALIFCTAYDEYALKAFQANAIGYLLKPVREEELTKALSQAGRLSQAHLKAIEALNQSDDKFVAHTWSGQELLNLNDIFYFRADQKYLSVIHKQGETLSNQTLKELEESLEDQFIRAHRNTLVNKQHIKALLKSKDGGHQIELSEGQRIDVSRRHYSTIKALFD